MFCFSHGIEQEFQIVDGNGNLAPAFDEIIERVPESYKKPNARGFRLIWQDDYKTQLEISTGVCWTYERLEYWLRQLRAVAIEAVEASGYHLVAAGCNPLKDLNPQEFFSEQHHVGVSNGEKTCRVLNAVRNDVHHLVSYSVNSPFHASADSGFKSYRMANAVAIGPISGLPYLAEPCDIKELRDLVRKDPRQLDATPISDWNTTEVRLFDSQPSVNLTLSTAIILQAMFSKAIKEKPPYISQNEIAGNRRLAIRLGMGAKFSGIPGPESLMRFLDSLEGEIEEMGRSKKELVPWRMAQHGKTLADWQMDVRREGGFERLAKHLIRYTKSGRGTLG